MFTDMRDHFEKLIKKLSPTIRRISHRLNGHFTFFNDDDLCQEALAHLWVLFRQNKLNDKTDSYILQGCYFHLKNYIRTSMDKASFTSIEKPIDEEGTMLHEILASRKNEYLERLEDEVLHEAMIENAATEREKQALNYLLDGLTTREIGAKLGISHVSIIKLKNRLKAKCKNLQKEIKDSYQN